MASSPRIISRLMRWCRISREGDGSADFPIQQVTYNGKTANAAMWFQYGIHANIPEDQGGGVGSLGLMLALHGNAEERVVLPGSPQRRPTLEPGELAVYHPPTGSIIHFKANGDIDITAPNMNLTSDVTITGDLTVTGDTALAATVTANGKDISDTHIHSGVTTGGSNTGAPV